VSHSHRDAEVVEVIAKKLEDEYHLKIWLDKWILIPGEPYRQKMSKGIDQAKTCIVVIGSTTPKGWFDEEIGKALSRQTKDDSFRVIPLLLPNAPDSYVADFLELRTKVKFKKSIDELEAFHYLICGVKGIQPGRFKSDYHEDAASAESEDKLKKINALYDKSLIDESVKIEYQRLIINDLLNNKNDER
jgi:hypothetical protein